MRTLAMILWVSILGPTAGANETEPVSTVLAFRPSSHGLAYANRFPVALEVPLGFTSWELSTDFGLCGGMIYRVLDAWESSQSIDRSPVRPRLGSEAYWRLVRRQAETLVPGVWAKVLEWQQRPDRERRWCPLTSLRRSVPRELRTLEARIDRGWVVPICLIRRFGFANPSYNHQVLVYGYERSGTTMTLRIYDPNHPNDDTVTLEVTLGRRRLYMRQSTGESNRGLFVMSYDRQRAGRPD